MAFSRRKKKKEVPMSGTLFDIKRMREAEFDKMEKDQKAKAKALKGLKKKYGIKPKEDC